MRACAFLILALTVRTLPLPPPPQPGSRLQVHNNKTVAYYTVASRVPPQPRKFHLGQYLTPFRSKPYRLLSLAMLMYAGVLLPNNYIIVQAQNEGMPDALADKMIVLLNAASSKSVPT